MVDIYLLAHGSEVPFLSIPLADVQRLSICPFKWLRFVLFAICGTAGELSAAPDGKPVDYHSTELGVDAIYYFKPSGEFIFVDVDGLNDEATLSTDSTGCCTDFRKSIMERDGFCVITQEYAEDCDAAHLIPSSKGNDYIQKVVQDRSPLYGPIATISGIDAIENGIFLNKTVHSKFSRGAVTFIKAPNLVAGLDPTDIQGYGGSTGTDTITMQQLEKPHNYDPDLVEKLANSGSLRPSIAFIHGASVDAVFQGSLPSPVILDYMYGVAAYKYWGSKPGHSVVERYYLEHYAQIPAPPCRPSSDKSNSSFNDLDNPNNPSSTSPKQRRYRSPKMGNTMANTMDELNLVLMLLQGTTPEEAASRKEKELEEEEEKAQEAEIWHVPSLDLTYLVVLPLHSGFLSLQELPR